MIALAAALAFGVPAAWGQAHTMEAGSPGLVEAGAPSFSVLGAESMGLDSPPTDIKLMPDGRLLVVAGQQLALGDGVRWEVFRQALADRPSSGLGAAVDSDGDIYMGVPGGGGRVNFHENRFWTLEQKPAALPAPGAATDTVVPQYVNQLGRDWYWYSASGPVTTWRPGETARTVARASSMETIFSFGGSVFLSDRIDGRLSRIAGGAPESVMAPGTLGAITCAVPFDRDHMLVGTYARGLQLFDGKSAVPFPAVGVFREGVRIDALCATDGDLFAAALDNFGIVLFNRSGRAVQVLDRSLDHRISGIKQLLPTTGGVLWGLAEGCVIRVGVPSRVSHFEPLMGASVTTVHPYRLDGRLWLIADGQTYRGAYDADGRLTGLELDTPDQLFVSSLSVAAGVPVDGTEQGAYARGSRGWVPVTPAVNNLRIIGTAPVKGRWLYCAQDELGWLRNSGGTVEIVKRYRVPSLPKVYNAVADKSGRIWLETGAGQFSRVQIRDGVPTVENFGPESGLPQSWAQIFEINGVVRFNFAEHIYQFDDATGRMEPDDAFTSTIPGLSNVIGRPGLDSRGRLWVVANGIVNIMEYGGGRWHSLPRSPDVPFQPYYLTFEQGGVVWMHSAHHLARYDPAMPDYPAAPSRAVITDLSLAASNRTLFRLGRGLRPLDYADNSIIAHFAASGNPFAKPVTFEVKLDGSGSDWASVGSAGSAVFNGLAEGSYVLHVRPKSGTEFGSEASLAFVIRPPWYRTPAAYAGFSLAAIAAILLPVWLMTLLERRENARLERLVATRTSELSETNTRLANQVEEIRVLTQAVVQSPIAVFVTKPDGTIEFTNPRCCELTGYSQVELVNSSLRQLRAPEVTEQTFGEISAALARGKSWSGQLANRRRDGVVVQVRSTMSPMLSPDGQIRHHLILEEDITKWLADQQRSRRLEAQLAQTHKMESIGTLAGGIAHDFNNILTGILGYCELASLTVGDDAAVAPELQQIRAAGLRAKDLVMQILTFSRQGNTKLVPLDIARPVAEALKLIRASASASIEIVQELQSGTILGDGTQIHQIAVNLCVNSLQAMHDRRGRLDVTVRAVHVDTRLAADVPNLIPGPYMRVTVVDTGAGMDPSTLERIFDPFFTTKSQGEGTGLGLAIVQGVVAGHGGAIQASSRKGEGTTFDLYFPASNETIADAAPAAGVPRGNGQRILLVEDETTVSAFAESRLRHFGYEPVTFNDPRAALAAFRAEPATFDALVTDLTMPHITGLELIDQIRSLNPHIPVVILTGYSRELTRERLAAIPNCILMQKPYTGEDLVRSLSQVIARHGAAGDSRGA